MPDSAGHNSPASSSPSPPAGTCLGFDFGLKRIGVACGNTSTQTSNPVDVVNNHNGTPDWQHIDTLVREWQPVALVVGRPVHMDGSIQDITHHAMGFKKRLAKRYSLPVFEVDERRTSIDAMDILKKNRQMQIRGRTRRGDVDKIAATQILQRWLEANSNVEH